jgi:AraC-like DNA-binding protein
MAKAFENQFLLFRSKEITEFCIEGLRCDRHLAQEVAKPLFDAGVMHIAITERVDYAGDRAVRHNHSLTLLLQGEMKVEIDNQHWTMGPGDIAYIPPDAVYQRRSNGPTWWIFINLFDIPKWRLLKKRGPFVRPYENVMLMFSLLRAILDAHASRGANNISFARENSRALVNLLRHELAGIESPALRHRYKLHQLIETISRHPERAWTVTDMAREVHVSTSLLTTLFQREYGQAPLELVIHHRVQKAAFLLQETDDTLEAIASAVGYKNPYSFSRLFTKHMGTSPGRYRRNPDA